jgi:hypothetical protein
MTALALTAALGLVDSTAARFVGGVDRFHKQGGTI